MKKILFLLFTVISLAQNNYAQTSGNLIVHGDNDKYYPVTFYDGGWANNVPTTLTLGRSSVHADGNWKGSLMASFRYHTTIWGNASNFIEADIAGLHSPIAQVTSFIAGWHDATISNGSYSIIIWLRGGGITYYTQSNYAVNPVVYDGVQNPLPYNEENGPSHSYKTTPDSYVASAIKGNNTFSGDLMANGNITSSVSSNEGGSISLVNPLKTANNTASKWTIYNMTGNYGNSLQFWSYSQDGSSYGQKMTLSDNGNVGIGTSIPDSKLTVYGNIHAKEVKVDLNIPGPDYVFANDYKLKTLKEVEDYIKLHSHLPEIPSAKEIEKNGILVGEMNMNLLKKIEELTLYVIEQNKLILKLQQESEKQKQEIKDIKLNLK